MLQQSGRIYARIHGRFGKCCNNLDEYMQEVIDKHLNPERLRPEHDHLIDVLLKLQKAGTSAIRLTNEHIIAILVDVFGAGVDTTAVTMNCAMAELIKNPAAMNKVQEEIRSYVGGNKGKVEEKDLDHFHYLKLVVKEALRLHPPLPLAMPRECMRKSKICGYDVRPKTRVLVNIWAIGRNPMHWDNPDDFNPERFIYKPADFGGQKDFDFLPFGGGRRGCPGIDMGMVTVELAPANLLYSFDWQLPTGMKKEDVNMEELSGMVTHLASSFPSSSSSWILTAEKLRTISRKFRLRLVFWNISSRKLLMENFQRDNNQGQSGHFKKNGVKGQWENAPNDPILDYLQPLILSLLRGLQPLNHSSMTKKLFLLHFT